MNSTSLQRCVLLFFLIFCGMPPASAQVPDTLRFDVTRNGRRILHDGFLMEWRTHTARNWDSSGTWVWDVVATTEGLAGYIRLQEPSPCSLWNISITSSVDRQKHELSLPVDTVPIDKALRFDHAEFDSSRTITVEWLFPYEEGIPDKNRPMTLTFTAKSSCGTPLPVLHLSYVAQPVRTGTKISMIGQGILIVVLALLYFSIQRKIKLQMLRQTQ